MLRIRTAHPYNSSRFGRKPSSDFRLVERLAAEVTELLPTACSCYSWTAAIVPAVQLTMSSCRPDVTVLNVVASIVEGLHRLEPRTTWMYRPPLTRCQEAPGPVYYFWPSHLLYFTQRWQSVVR